MTCKIAFGDKTYIMGIINVNDDSFYTRSRIKSIDECILKANQMIKEGADIIDIGGESTRPGSTFIEEKEEIKRVIPMIKEIVNLGVIVSIDTYKYNVAKLATENGARIINDISGGRDRNMLKLAKEYGVYIILMHNYIKENEFPHAKLIFNENLNIVQNVMENLEFMAKRAQCFGIDKENIILDPGIGFGKHWKDNLKIMRNIYRIKDLGYNVLIGASNKSFIGKVLNIDNPEERINGTLSSTAISIMQGADIIRVHDVKVNAEVAKFTDRICR